ncbi:zinc finger BED domain-containing 1-like, partial [Paramuricea clavata]
VATKAVQHTKQAEETSTFSDDDSNSDPKASESSKKAQKSIGYAEDEEEVRDSAVCQVCSQAIKKRMSNTSNLLRHLPKKHPVQYATINPKKSNTGSCVSGEKTSTRFSAFTECLGATIPSSQQDHERIRDGSMNDMLLHWKLDELNQVAITTDNGANIKKACRDNNWLNVPCFGHNLHLAITNTLSKKTRVSHALGICKKVVAAFGTSWKRRRNLEAAQVQEEPGKKVKKLALECPTQWGSTLHMISCVLANKKAIRRVLGNDKDTSHLVPSWQDLESRYVAEDLKVLMDVTSFIDPRYITDFLTTTDEAEQSELNVVQERLLEQAVFFNTKKR